VSILEGKTAAVTCVDWQPTKVGDLLISSSDDRTVHCWTKHQIEEKWELYHKFDSLYRNLMITYCALEKHGEKIACVTMGGYFYLWDLIGRKAISSIKSHIGSIEGLSWNHKKNIVATCASDCCINLYAMQPDKLEAQNTGAIIALQTSESKM